MDTIKTSVFPVSNFVWNGDDDKYDKKEWGFEVGHTEVSDEASFIWVVDFLHLEDNKCFYYLTFQ